MNDLFRNTNSSLRYTHERKNSQHSFENSHQTRSTILIQENRKLDDSSSKKEAVLRTIDYDSFQDGLKENRITIISTIRDQEQVGFSLFTPSGVILPPRVNTFQLQSDLSNNSNQQSITKYKLISPTTQSNYRNQNQQLNNISSISQNKTQTSNAFSLSQFLVDRDLQIIEQNQQNFQYKAFVSHPELFHYSNLSKEEKIEYLLSNQSFSSPDNNYSMKESDFFQQYNQINRQNIQKQKTSSIEIHGQKNKNSSSRQRQLFNNLRSKIDLNQNQKRHKVLNQLALQSQSTSDSSSPSKSFQLEDSQSITCEQETKNVISVVSEFVTKHSVMKGQQIFEWIDELVCNKYPHDNYIHKFIFHKKYKDFETEEQKYKGASRFHNLNRMFMHNIIKILVKENLQKFDIPYSIMTKITQIVTGIKNEAFKKYNNGKSKTCFFNHHHYNLLFLQINSQTLEMLSKSSKDLELHQSTIGVSLEGQNLNSVDIQYCNIIKYYIYLIVNTTIERNIQSADYNNCVRLQYVQRVLNGIKKLSEGQPIKRF